MGRRELVIALVFVVLAVAAYQLTVPPPKDGEEGFSFSRLFAGIRKEITQHNATGSITRTGTIKVKDDVSELRLTAGRSVPIIVSGEHRDDIAFDLWVQSNGPDEAAARALADQTQFTQDDLGTAIAMKLRFPEPGEQTAKLTLRVPDRLLVRFEGAGRVAATGLRAVELRNLAGETNISKIREFVKGSHRTGDLAISMTGTVDISMTTSTVRLEQIGNSITVTGRQGTCTVTGSTAAIDATVTNVDFSIIDHGGPVRVTGDGGVLKIAQPAKELNVDARRMKIEVAIAAAVPATIISTDEAIKIVFGGTPSAAIDAVVSDKGEIRASDVGLVPTRVDRESRLSGALGAGGPRVLLRNTRGDIVIALRK